ncbi:MAG TPA: ABC transporter ATP-binding protein [Desulfitobacterium dehalogenans]|uniref:ABC transporter ATP-binding protein n=1 Tax=Desulfitobacterium dehalogenans TaxID=36854 RepID=A0A7C6Z4P7_9FIRM|nr:ABC transporter ATP-binding protein [Desulfitobacterium dehalogenans]
MKCDDFVQLVHSKSLGDVLMEYPIGADFLVNLRLDGIAKERPLLEALQEVDEEILMEFGLKSFEVVQSFCQFLETFSLKGSAREAISSLTIHGGYNKLKEPEAISLTIYPGEIISIVGPTGSGKSRLLNDIECLAQGDTPTGRIIRINGSELNDSLRFEMEGKLVAQLSQNMNFVMDLTVREFLVMHAKSRLTPHAEDVILRCFQCANNLAGEKFSEETKVTQLSGGQSRALMIADTAFISESPVVLIDEIENAGIDRKQAITLLANREKIILVSTHDPLLALSADKRIVIKDGGIAKIIDTTEEERESLKTIEKLDNVLGELRNRLRSGEIIAELPAWADN